MKASLWGSWESAESRVRPIRRIVRVFNGMTPPPAPQNSVCSRVLTCALLQQHGRGWGWGWGAGVRRASKGRADTAGALGHRAACQPRGGPGLWRQHRNRFIGKAGSEAPHTLPPHSACTDPPEGGLHGLPRTAHGAHPLRARGAGHGVEGDTIHVRATVPSVTYSPLQNRGSRTAHRGRRPGG